MALEKIRELVENGEGSTFDEKIFFALQKLITGEDKQVTIHTFSVLSALVSPSKKNFIEPILASTVPLFGDANPELRRAVTIFLNKIVRHAIAHLRT
jgi:hypothetical protein